MSRSAVATTAPKRFESLDPEVELSRVADPPAEPQQRATSVGQNRQDEKGTKDQSPVAREPRKGLLDEHEKKGSYNGSAQMARTAQNDHRQ